MRVLVTRPQPQAHGTAALLRARGHQVHCFPLTRIERLTAELPPAASVDAILLTSGNAAFALERYAALPVFAVGEATARAAATAGAGKVTTAAGDWRSLAQLLAGPGGPPAGARLLHLAGAEVRGDLAGAAAAAGFAVTRRVVYAARAVDWLDAPTTTRLARSELDAACFFSPAHATIWRHLVDRAALRHCLFSLVAVALSPAVAASISDLPWRALRVARAPEVAQLIDRLEAPG